MKPLLPLLTLSVLLCAGCADMPGVVAIKAPMNRSALKKVEAGMTMAQVREIVGEPDKVAVKDGVTTWSYVTSKIDRTGGLHDDNYTPVQFKDGVVVGWGR